MANDKNESTERPGFIIVKWVLLKGEPTVVKLKGSLSEFTDLNNFSSCLKQKFDELKNVKPQKPSKPLVIRYPLSDANSEYQMPHTSGFWSLLREAIIERFDKDVFQDMLKQDHTSLDTKLEEKYYTLCNEIKNKATSCEFISIFMNTAVRHVQLHVNENTWLSVEVELDGSCSYDYADYAVYIQDNIVLVDEAKWKDLVEGIAQYVMEMYTLVEKLERPIVEISEKYVCRFKEDTKNSKDVIEYIIRILLTQATSFLNDNRNNKHISKCNKSE
ncbi:14753_t:CDS:2 [Cetraspora pellucida]|uniref:14753_t:CDS:1 n=1 Tax=Cetraspora pellucida TaxID=1433469 RepID=A0A9N8YXP2_9GLOM|nr:14753_t:CDS:2 [Cetraspora pellucida]